jgi:hypothetical protein
VECCGLYGVVGELVGRIFGGVSDAKVGKDMFAGCGGSFGYDECEVGVCEYVEEGGMLGRGYHLLEASGGDPSFVEGE